jgi:hypothetical protein
MNSFLSYCRFFIMDEIQHDDVCLQNQIIGKNHTQSDPNFKYKAQHTAYHSISAGNLVSPKTDPGDYVIEKTGDIKIQAGAFIQLKPGFEVQAGGTFHAYIGEENCSRPRTSENFSGNQQNDNQEFFTNPESEIAIFQNQEHEIFKIKLAVFPNPSSGLINVSVNENGIGMQYNVFNVSGQIVESGLFIERNQRLQSTLPNGVYYVHVSNDQYSTTEKIIVL